MISCRLQHLEQRCRQRGYTLDEVRACIVSADGDAIVVDELHPAYPREPKPGFVPLNTSPSPPPLDLTRTDAPTFLTKVKNFAKAAAAHVAAGMPMAPDEEIIRRHDICQGCEFMKNNACTKCGCPLVRGRKYVSKLSWAGSECPVGKWGRVEAATTTPPPKNVLVKSDAPDTPPSDPNTQASAG